MPRRDESVPDTASKTLELAEQATILELPSELPSIDTSVRTKSDAQKTFKDA